MDLASLLELVGCIIIITILSGRYKAKIPSAKDKKVISLKSAFLNSSGKALSAPFAGWQENWVNACLKL